VLFVSAEGNEMAPGVAELHLQAGDDITVIFPDGTELYVAGNGDVTAGDGRSLGNVVEPGIRAHIEELHPRIKLRRRTDDELAHDHGEDHYRYGIMTHHHGPNAGPNARPRGWRDGSGVVLIDRQAAMRARKDGPEETVTRWCVRHNMELQPGTGTGLYHVRHGDRCDSERIIVRREHETGR
jgi:hypothetical protein